MKMIISIMIALLWLLPAHAMNRKSKSLEAVKEPAPKDMKKVTVFGITVAYVQEKSKKKSVKPKFAQPAPRKSSDAMDAKKFLAEHKEMSVCLRDPNKTSPRYMP